jgi:hypothetical protein
MKILTCVLFLFVSFSGISQSAWTQKKGNVYSQLSFSSISNFSEIFGDPDYLTEREITDQTLQIYAEYGYTEKTTLIVNIPFKFIKTSDLVNPLNISPLTISDSKSTLGNVEIGLKHKLYDKKWVVSTQLNIEANTSSFDRSSGINSGYNAWGFTPTINVARSFNGFYIQGFSGINLRTNKYSSNFKMGGEIGTKPLKKLWLIAYTDIIISFKNGTIALPLSNELTSLYVNNQEYAAYGLKSIYLISENFGATAGFGGAFYGNNVAKRIALNFGLYHKF